MREIAQEQIAARTDHLVLNPCRTLDDCLGQEYMKGEIAGYRLLADLPDLTIASILKDLKDAPESEES